VGHEWVEVLVSGAPAPESEQAVPLAVIWCMSGARLMARITNATLSSTFLIYAKTDTKGPASKGITAFLVERGSKGFEVGEHLDKFGVSMIVGQQGDPMLRADERFAHCRAVL